MPRLPRDREDQLRARLNAGAQPNDGVCTLRGKDVVRILEKEFGLKYRLGGAYDLLGRLGYSCLTPRPLHEKSDPEVIADGFIVESVEQVVEAIRRIPALDRRTCRNIFEERFEASRMARSYINVYEKSSGANCRLSECC